MNSAVDFSIADFPGYAEDAAKEQAIRSAACIGLNEIICGFEAKPLTAAHVLLLNLVRSPFLRAIPVAVLCAKPDILTDIMRFLWIVSPDYEQGSKASASRPWWQIVPRKPTARDRFNAKFALLAKVKLDALVSSILEYVEDAFIDAEKPKVNETRVSYYAQEVSIAYEFSKFHGYRLDFWNTGCPADKNPLHIPLKIVFQLRKVRREAELGKDAGLSNRSDERVEAGLAALAEKNRRN